ncbi:LysM peptidoglycan-binding domain-containing protein [Bacillus sp. CRN 9]|nr:LysM peptidoglycan-binding domain-containing protein [Bacillus sp. CRN 9]
MSFGSAVCHEVASSDTIYVLSLTYGSTIQQVRNWNGLVSSYTIRIGQILRANN